MEKESSFSNSILKQSMRRVNSANPLKREDILKNYSDATIASIWESFCKIIARNYQAGRATLIPKFGTFAFLNAEVNLEGTTNTASRDLKAKKPVFIVSNDFVERLKPGIYTGKTFIYFNQKLNNSSTVKINYAEIAISLDIKKEEVMTILDNYIKFLADSIIKGNFKNKELPSLGTLVLTNNILAVKFDDNLISNIKHMPQKLSQTKKHINLNTEIIEKNNNANNNFSNTITGNLPNLSKSLSKLRPNT